MVRRANGYCRVAVAAGVLWFAFAAVPLYSKDFDVSRPVEGSTAVEVLVTIFVVDVDEVDTSNQSFDANVYLEYIWHDPGIAHKEKGLVSKPLTEVWEPRIVVVNEQRVWATFPEVVTISPMGNVIYRQRIWGTFSQPLDLRDFPFDRQTFVIQLAAVGYTPDEVDMKRDAGNVSGMAEKLSVADWKVITWTAEPMAYQPIPGGRAVAGYAFSFEAQRLTSYFVVKVILPLVLIVAMSWVVFWMDPREVGSNIGVSVTSMLTLIAYRFAVDSSLPNLSYLTRLDYFILSSTFLVFLTLVQVAISSSLANYGSIEISHRVDRWSRMLFPVAFVLITMETLVFRIVF